MSENCPDNIIQTKVVKKEAADRNPFRKQKNLDHLGILWLTSYVRKLS